MKILVVFAHPAKDSFNREVLKTVLQGLELEGHEVQVADLNREGFQPAFKEEDFAQFKNRPMPDDVLREQARVEWSEGLVFIFPVWWWSLPGILKGWIDRVFTFGWAWEDPSDPTSGHLKDRQILVLPSAGASKAAFAKRRYDEALGIQLNTGTWSYCGFNNVTTETLHDITPDADPELINRRLVRAGELARTTFV